MTRMQTGIRRIRTGLVAGAALLALTGTLTACGSSDTDDETIEGAQTEDSTGKGDNGDDSEADDIAALKDVYRQYWGALVELENSRDSELDASAFDGVTNSDLSEYELTRMSTYKDYGYYREGEPEISDITVEVDGDTARIQSCINEGNWPLFDKNGEVVDDPELDDLDVPYADVVDATRTDGGWLITESLDTKEATITC